jgi:hemerythrin
MSQIDWNPAWETGVPIIDRQHRQLVDHAARLLNEVLEGRTQVDVQGSLAFLVKFSDFHFDEEERIMAGAAYPPMAEHCLEHGKLREHLERMLERLAREPESLTAELVRFVHHWIARHVDTHDRALAGYLVARNLPAPE